MNNDNDDAQEPITRQQVVDLLAANREDMLSRESAQQIIGNRLHRHRPISWENDISLNALDETPFEVAPSPAEIALQTFNAAIKENSSCSPETLGDRDVMELIAKDTLPIPARSRKLLSRLRRKILAVRPLGLPPSHAGC